MDKARSVEPKAGRELRVVSFFDTPGVPPLSTWESAPVGWHNFPNLQETGFGVESGAPHGRRECPWWSRWEGVEARWKKSGQQCQRTQHKEAFEASLVPVLPAPPHSPVRPTLFSHIR